jgi:hypothetical protein
LPRLDRLQEPPAGAKQRLLARLERMEAHRPPPRLRALRSLLADLSPLHPLRAAALAVCLLISGSIALDWYRDEQALVAEYDRMLASRVQDAMALASTPHVESVSFRGSPASPYTEGSVLLHPEHRRGMIIVHRLQPAPQGQVFQLWVWDPRLGVLLPRGTFRTLPEGIGVWSFQPPVRGTTPILFGVTQEPAGGSESPTSPLLFSGQLPPELEVEYPDDRM